MLGSGASAATAPANRSGRSRSTTTTATASPYYLHSAFNSPSSVTQRRPVTIEPGRWVHVEARYVRSATNGRITVWQDGRRILHASGVQTAFADGENRTVWGIGNDTDRIAGGPRVGTATVFFDDAVVATRRVFDGRGRDR